MTVELLVGDGWVGLCWSLRFNLPNVDNDRSRDEFDYEIGVCLKERTCEVWQVS